MLATTRAPFRASAGSSDASHLSTPGFWSPTLLSIPPAISRGTNRGAGLPAQTSADRDLTTTAPRRETGSSVYQVFEGTGEVSVGDTAWQVERGDLFVVPSWHALTVAAYGGLDLFRFTDAPILEQLHQYRTQTG